MPLADKVCVPCMGGVPALTPAETEPLLKELPGWEVIDNHHLFRSLTFADFQTALDYVNRVGAVAEEQGHHPDLLLSWGRVGITIYTHKINGLTESDFVLAAKLDRIYSTNPT